MIITFPQGVIEYQPKDIFSLAAKRTMETKLQKWIGSRNNISRTTS